MYLNSKELEELDELIELFDESVTLEVSFDDGRNIELAVSCFKLIKEIVDGRVNKTQIAQEIIDDAKEQLNYTEEFFYSTGIVDTSIFKKGRFVTACRLSMALCPMLRPAVLSFPAYYFYFQHRCNLACDTCLRIE